MPRSRPRSADTATDEPTFAPPVTVGSGSQGVRWDDREFVYLEHDDGRTFAVAADNTDALAAFTDDGFRATVDQDGVPVDEAEREAALAGSEPEGAAAIVPTDPANLSAGDAPVDGGADTE